MGAWIFHTGLAGQGEAGGVGTRVLEARWLAGGVAAASVALMAGSLALALADRLAALGGRLEVRVPLRARALPSPGTSRSPPPAAIIKHPESQKINP